MNNCPAQSFIPIWLVVYGVCCALQQIKSLVEGIRKRNRYEEIEDSSCAMKCFNVLFGLFNLAWFIAGKSLFEVFCSDNLLMLSAELSLLKGTNRRVSMICNLDWSRRRSHFLVFLES